MTHILNHCRLPGLPVLVCESPAHPFRPDATHAKLGLLADADTSGDETVRTIDAAVRRVGAPR